MCCKNGSCKGHGCVPSMIAKVLVIVGGLNWGLVGLGMLVSQTIRWNLVNMIFNSMPLVEGIVYLLVGVSALVMVFGCKCKKCTSGTCDSCAVSSPATAPTDSPKV